MRSKHIWDLFIPLAISIFLLNIQTFVDSVIIANYDIYAVSAVSIATQITSLFGPIFFGIISGANIFIVQYYASNRHALVTKVLGIALTFIIPIAFFTLFCLTMFDEQIIGFFVDPASTVGVMSIQYLEIYKWVLFLIPFDMIFTYQFRAMKMTKIPMKIGVIQTIVNIVLDICLIYGLAFFPEMGIVGAAYATLIAKFVSLGLGIFYAMYLKAPFITSPMKYFNFNNELFKDVKKAILPLILIEMGWGFGRILTTKIMVSTGVDQFTIYSLARQISFLVNFLVMATANVSGIMTGSVLGKGEDVTKSQKELFSFIKLMSVLVLLLHFIVLPILMPLFGVESEFYKITYLVIIANGLFMALRVFSSSFIAILKSGGDNNFIIIIDIGVTYLIMLPSLWFCAYVLDFGVVALSFVLCSEMVFKTLIGYYRYKTKKWIKKF